MDASKVFYVLPPDYREKTILLRCGPGRTCVEYTGSTNRYWRGVSGGNAFTCANEEWFLLMKQLVEG